MYSAAATACTIEYKGDRKHLQGNEVRKVNEIKDKFENWASGLLLASQSTDESGQNQGEVAV
jgi:hypothetical protein